jgi:hypothetical protein
MSYDTNPETHPAFRCSTYQCGEGDHDLCANCARSERRDELVYAAEKLTERVGRCVYQIRLNATPSMLDFGRKPENAKHPMLWVWSVVDLRTGALAHEDAKGENDDYKCAFNDADTFVEDLIAADLEAQTEEIERELTAAVPA